jgi:hypothetical protein
MKTIYRQTIIKTTILVSSISVAVLLAFVSGCATARQTEDLLSAAGFKAQPAITAPQQAHLKSLPDHKVSSVRKDGNQYFVYPDVARNVLYVGQSAQYEQYKKLRAQQALTEEQINPAEEREIQTSVWGAW